MKRFLKIGLIVLFLIGIVFFLVKIFISNQVEDRIAELINNNKSDKYTTSVGNVKFKLLDRSITLNNLFIGPKISNNLDSLSQNIEHDSLEKITISSIKINDIYYLDYIRDKYVRIGEIDINDVFINETNRKKSESKNTKQDGQPKIDLDSINIKGISGFEIDRFNFNNIQYTVVDSISYKPIFHHKPASFNIDGFQLTKVHDQIFKVDLIDNIYKINGIELSVSNENYNLAIEEVNFNTKTFDIQIKNLKLEPFEGKIALANKFKYNDPVLNFDIGMIQLYHFDLVRLLKKQGVFIDSILISKGSFEFYKDKRKPYNEKVVKKLPQQLLKEMKTPIFIDNITIDNCLLIAENRFPHKDLDMKLFINSIYGNVKNVSNIKEFAKTPMTLNTHAKLMNQGYMKVNFVIPLNDKKNTFYFDGSLSSSKFVYYDKVIYPALGLKILKGNLDYLTFKAKADNYSASGTMKMLYHDLDATVYKKKTHEKNKFLSWAIKTVLHNSNPVKHKDVRIAKMYHKHEKYRGFGGYLWKTLQSGIVNTLSPLGNKTSKKADKMIDKKKRKKEKR